MDISDPELDHKFWANVAPAPKEQCWPWLGSRHKARGYGYFYHRGEVWRAHRLAWVLANKTEIPKDKVACHACDNPQCVNPNHIWIGTQAENIQDAIKKKRMTTPTQRGLRYSRPLATHCKHGHPFDKENTAYKYKRRVCIECRRNDLRRWREKRKSL